MDLYLLESIKKYGSDLSVGFATAPFQSSNADHGYVFVNYKAVLEEGHPTVVHEVGHFLSLLHTYIGGCDGPGDEIDDTPRLVVNTTEALYETECPVGRDTCPDDPGLDPISNYMGYAGP